MLFETNRPLLLSPQIVGGGLAGLTVASRLSEDRNVTVSSILLPSSFFLFSFRSLSLPSDDVVSTSSSRISLSFFQIQVYLHVSRGCALGFCSKVCADRLFLSLLLLFPPQVLVIEAGSDDRTNPWVYDLHQYYAFSGSSLDWNWQVEGGKSIKGSV